jgi:hypothetical protein
MSNVIALAVRPESQRQGKRPQEMRKPKPVQAEIGRLLLLSASKPAAAADGYVALLTEILVGHDGASGVDVGLAFDGLALALKAQGRDPEGERVVRVLVDLCFYVHPTGSMRLRSSPHFTRLAQPPTSGRTDDDKGRHPVIGEGLGTLGAETFLSRAGRRKLRGKRIDIAELTALDDAALDRFAFSAADRRTISILRDSTNIHHMYLTAWPLSAPEKVTFEHLAKSGDHDPEILRWLDRYGMEDDIGYTFLCADQRFRRPVEAHYRADVMDDRGVLSLICIDPGDCKDSPEKRAELRGGIMLKAGCSTAAEVGKLTGPRFGVFADADDAHVRCVYGDECGTSLEDAVAYVTNSRP